MKKIKLSGIVFFFLLVCSLSTVHAVTLNFVPSSSDIHVGDYLDVDLVISGLVNDDLSAFDLVVDYSSSLLSFNSYSLGNQLGDLDFYEDWSLGYLGGGEINLSELSFLTDLSWQDDEFVLATLNFKGIDTGNALIEIDQNYEFFSIGDFYGDELSPVIMTPFSIEISQNTNPVPEPSSVLLLATGLFGLGMAAKRHERDA